MRALTDRHAIRIVRDEEYNSRPGDFVAWTPEEDAAYVARFECGELTAYIVELVVDTYGDGQGDDYEAVESLGGCDVENGAADGFYHSLEAIPDDYLRSVAAELVSEAPEPFTCGTCDHVWHYDTPASRCPREYDHEDEEPARPDSSERRPTLVEEAERLLSYWEIHGNDPAVVAKWAVEDMLGLLRFIVETPTNETKEVSA